MYRIEVNHNDKENERIHKQCERMVKLVDDEQIALIVLGEYSKQEGGIRCKATTVVHANEQRQARTRRCFERKYDDTRRCA